MIAVTNKGNEVKPGKLNMTVDSGCDQNTQWITIFLGTVNPALTLYYGQFALSLGKGNSSYTFSFLYPHNTDTFHGPFSLCRNGV